jgi:hypothetical protein
MVLMVGHILIANVGRCFFAYKAGKHPRFSATTVFDGATFGTSSMLLWGVLDPTILAFLGDTTLFLVIAGISGVIYSLYALLPRL